MNKIKLIILLVALAVCGSSSRLFGQAAVPFDCNSSGMILTQGDGSSTTTFYHVNTSTNPFTFETMFTIPYNLNSTAYNPVDNYLYAFPASYTGNNNINKILRIDANGNYDVVTIAVPGTAPGGTAYKGGACDIYGNLFLSTSSADNAIYFVNMNVTPYVQTRLGLGTGNTVNLPDVAWNPADGKLYGVDGTAYTNASGIGGKLTVFTITYDANHVPTGATFTRVGNGNSLNSFGAMYIGSNGALFGSLNDGGFYQFNTATGARTLISDSPGSSVNDGANCPTVPIAFGADIQITKTDNDSLLVPGKTYTYIINVTNAGPFGAEGVVVTDTIPEGIPAENITYTAATVDAPNGNTATTTITGTGTGMLRDTVSLEVGSSVVYTVKLTVPADFNRYLLENCASAVPASSTKDPNLFNNSSCDIDKTPHIPVNPNVRVWMLP